MTLELAAGGAIGASFGLAAVSFGRDDFGFCLLFGFWGAILVVLVTLR